MQVFELYMRRIMKRKLLLASLFLLPLVASYILVQALKPSDELDYAVILNSIIGILVCLTISNTMLFYSDRYHATDKRILLGIHSKSRFICQLVSVFIVISVIQLSAAILFTHFVLRLQLPFTFKEYCINLLAYILLNIIAVGIGLFVTRFVRRKSNGWFLLFCISIVLVVLGGLLLPSDQLPIIVRDIVMILPTYWLTKVVTILFSGVGGQLYPLINYLIALTVFAAAIMLLLIRLKTE